MSIEAMKQALEALTDHGAPYLRHGVDWDDAITALRAAIAEQEKCEPVAWRPINDAQWVNLVNHAHAWEGFSKDEAVHEVVKMTEAKCRENNTHPTPAPVPAGMVLVQEDQLKTLIQSITEMSHARRNPDWFTKGKQGAENQWFLWEQRGLEAIKTITAAPKPGEMK